MPNIIIKDEVLTKLLQK